jgi:uncharacterized membrane protein
MYRKLNFSLIKVLSSAVFILIVFIFVSYPLFHDGFFPTFDDVQVVRIDEMAKELLHGQFPVRYANNLGNGGGYMFFNFYSPLVYYLGALIHIVGISLVKSTKIIFILGYLVGALSMFVVLKKRVNLLSSTLGTVLFLFSAYLSYEVYTRGTLAEFFGMSMLPLFFGLTLWLKEHARVPIAIILGIVFGILVYAHIFIAINAILLFVLIYSFPPYNRKTFIFGTVSLLTGVLLSSSFLLPLFFEEGFTKYSLSGFGLNSYKTNFLSIFQLLGFQNIPWGFRPPILGLSISVGVIIVLIGTLTLRKKNYLPFGSFTAFLISLFLASDVSRFIWNSSGYLKMLQFPWRFLAGATVAGIFTISLFVNKLKKWPAVLLSLFLIILALSNSSYFRPSGYNYIANYTADDICSTTTWAQEYLPRWTSVCLPKSKDKSVPEVIWDNNQGSISLLKVTNYGRQISFLANLKKDGNVLVRRYYFPGWEAFVDNKQISINTYGKEGLISLNIPSGSHNVGVMLIGTKTQRIGNWISLGTLFAILGVIAFRIKAKKLL